jgi:peptide/nickel transport system substrate-binding protein
VTVREMPTSQLFALATEPADTRPDLLFGTYGPDALHVDTMVRIYLRTGAVPLNWFNYSNAEIDSEMDEALVEPTKDEVNAHYVTIADIVKDEAWVLPFGRRLEAVIARKGITNIVGNAYLPSIITAAELKDA